MDEKAVPIQRVRHGNHHGKALGVDDSNVRDEPLGQNRPHHPTVGTSSFWVPSDFSHNVPMLVAD